ncbi:NADPH-dependent F420 reductase [Modestobacter sp. VKM Ac-2979]|uniref:NADPH-dependent F420 reductase n=1 Tax=unclassified Modestobacter TaxID=2643866 RepID=UPI0022AB6EDF|nr:MULTISPECIES: NADPH-dependent F420 reductase [unclassified Modestobacter]MCZ2813939.1 NADPH-dependent F420 reductase [Modestobacter sp. VKM Ac-2979]MCZ2844646.1 NADPH-dependent F420 reductase [Modestobacter sp. VKM Ac-2980]
MSVIAVLGGTGAQGKGLALQFAKAGHDIILGSRSAERAVEVALTINERIGDGPEVAGQANAEACRGAEIVVLAVPYEGHGELVGGLRFELSGKILVSPVNPLGFDGNGPFGLVVPDGSAAEEAARIVPDARVVGAFHHVSATSLWKDDGLEHEVVLVCGDDAEAKAQVGELAAAVTGQPGVDAGPLRMARQLEPLTAVLININKRYKIRSGLAVTGLARNSH